MRPARRGGDVCAPPSGGLSRTGTSCDVTASLQNGVDMPAVGTKDGPELRNIADGRAGATDFGVEGQLVQKDGPWWKGPFLSEPSFTPSDVIRIFQGLR